VGRDDALLGTLLTAGPRNVKTLVQTDGGAVTLAQRGILQKALEHAQIRVAVISDDPTARMTSSAVALANRNHRSFSTAEWDRAFLHLGLTPDEGRAAQAALKTMAILVA
jgi:late competence protein required for DNA uptake (superfamily II DNA/RNA helicase)